MSRRRVQLTLLPNSYNILMGNPITKDPVAALFVYPRIRILVKCRMSDIRDESIYGRRPRSQPIQSDARGHLRGERGSRHHFESIMVSSSFLLSQLPISILFLVSKHLFAATDICVRPPNFVVNCGGVEAVLAILTDGRVMDVRNRVSSADSKDAYRRAREQVLRVYARQGDQQQRN